MLVSNLLTITWGTGHAYIHMDKFFPCTSIQFKKLRKMIDNDPHPEMLYQQMADHFREQIFLCNMFPDDPLSKKNKAWYEKELKNVES